MSLFIKLQKFLAPHFVVGPEDPAPITILNFLLSKFFLIFCILFSLIKKLASVEQLVIPKDFSVNFFAASTKCNLFYNVSGYKEVKTILQRDYTV